jgi:hypothetical protein
VLSLPHEVVAVDQDLPVEETHVLDEDALQVGVEVQRLLQPNGVSTWTVGEDDGSGRVDNDDLAGKGVEIATKDLQDEGEGVDDSHVLVGQQLRNVADGEGANEEDALLLVQRQNHTNGLVVGPLVDLRCEGSLLQGDQVDLLLAPAQHHSLPVLLATPAVLYGKTPPLDTHSPAEKRVLHPHEVLTIP